MVVPILSLLLPLGGYGLLTSLGMEGTRAGEFNFDKISHKTVQWGYSAPPNGMFDVFGGGRHQSGRVLLR